MASDRDFTVDHASREDVVPIPGSPTPLSTSEHCRYWDRVPFWCNTTAEDFLNHSWQTANTVQGASKLEDFLSRVLPDDLMSTSQPLPNHSHIRTPSQFIAEVQQAIALAPMSIRLTPHTLSLIKWDDVLNDPIRKQFIPLKSSLLPDHPKLSLDSLHETRDSPVDGIVHRYPDKALFLATSVCPVYCRFCTRSYAIGAPTETVTKHSYPPGRRRWEKIFDYIEKTPSLRDIVVSGGDVYYLNSDQILLIGKRLLSIPHIRRIRFATKGLAVLPMRILTDPAWTENIVRLSNLGRSLGKHVAIHTHFNHPREINWVTIAAAQKLFENGVTVRNQTVLLRGVNDDVETMRTLIHQLADINVIPYYVYQGDMVKGVEDLRTPLSTILNLEKEIRGSISGFMTPNFVVDLPGGGGKRLASSFDSYDPKTGVAIYSAPSVARGVVFEYNDPLPL
ncbi:hypothetical protein DL96DRAFT_1539235 [Flagelloscypha sp. PMI_526]|nr:hypothetical protein DL96DRAFT_1539235 [Flagelloscypha sp. PMI_526]